MSGARSPRPPGGHPPPHRAAGLGRLGGLAPRAEHALASGGWGLRSLARSGLRPRRAKAGCRRRHVLDPHAGGRAYIGGCEVVKAVARPEQRRAGQHSPHS